MLKFGTPTITLPLAIKKCTVQTGCTVCMYVCMYIFIVYDKGLDWVVYLKSVENVITLGKLIGLLFLFCLPLLSILFLKTPKIR